MKGLLVFYFILLTLCDPWIESAPVLNDNLINYQTQNINQGVAETDFSKTELTATHDHKHNQDCNEGCKLHSCHIGHCSFTFGNIFYSIQSFNLKHINAYNFVLSQPFLERDIQPPIFS